MGTTAVPALPRVERPTPMDTRFAVICIAAYVITLNHWNLLVVIHHRFSLRVCCNSRVQLYFLAGAACSRTRHRCACIPDVVHMTYVHR